MFPLSAQALDGHRVLFIGIDPNDPRTAFFVSGDAEWSGTALQIVYSPDVPHAVPGGTPPAWRGFDPAMLPRVLTPEAWHHVEPLSRDVEACVVSWVSAPLPEALVQTDPFFGLAANQATGEVFATPLEIAIEAFDNEPIRLVA